ncbi:MAG: GDP-mannose-dependent alpha-mannosyltransferase [Wenzhouxiangellaceae bacterium]
MSEPSPIRVAFVSDSEPERNGVGAYYVDLTDQLDPTRVTPRLFCPGRMAARIRLPLPGDRTQKLVLPPLRLGRELRRFDPQAIVVATPGPWGLWGMRLARRCSSRLIVGFHTDYAGVTDLMRNPLLRRASRAWFRDIDRMMLSRADEVLVNSEPLRAHVESLGAQRVRRIGTLVARVMLDDPPPVTTRIRRVLFAGRLSPEKRMDTVIEAARRLPDIEFALAGDGPMQAQVRHAAQDLPNLHWLGWLDRPGLRSALDQCDALLLPSAFESFGTVALEAMARARPALVTSNCGIADWPELRAGLVVFDPDTPRSKWWPSWPPDPPKTSPHWPGPDGRPRWR